MNATPRTTKTDGRCGVSELKLMTLSMDQRRKCRRVRVFQGCGATITRAMVVNAAQLASYSQAKQLVLSTGEVQHTNTNHKHNTQKFGCSNTSNDAPQ